jgi:hypothetical protein
MRTITCVTLLFALAAFSPLQAKVLFEDNFDSNKVDTNKWEVFEQKAWQQADGVVTVMGGEFLALTKQEFDDFILMVDYMPVKVCGGLAFRAQDRGNAYMLNMPVSGQWTPYHIRWHIRQNNSWVLTPDKIPDVTNASKIPKDIKEGDWCKVKLIAEGFKFTIYMNDQLAGEWVDDAKTFARGKLGFRQSGGAGDPNAETAKFDNFIVTDLAGAVVEAKGKLPIIWGLMKSR